MSNKGKKWTDELDNQLLTMVEEGYPISQIASTMGRTECSINCRLSLVALKMKEYSYSLDEIGAKTGLDKTYIQNLVQNDIKYSSRPKTTTPKNNKSTNIPINMPTNYSGNKNLSNIMWSEEQDDIILILLEKDYTLSQIASSMHQSDTFIKYRIESIILRMHQYECSIKTISNKTKLNEDQIQKLIDNKTKLNNAKLLTIEDLHEEIKSLNTKIAFLEEKVDFLLGEYLKK
jgi:hypothetical protein